MKKNIKEKIIQMLDKGLISHRNDIVADKILELFEDEYKNGYNQCLRDLGKTGERWLHLYL